MSRIETLFSSCKASGRKALVTYIVAGDPTPDSTAELMHALVRGGADLIELGVPFSDPMADGPTIQLACERALAHGTGLFDVIDMVAAFRKRDTRTPVVLMGYLNPVEIRGIEAVAARAAAAGVDGLLLVDLAAEEAGDYVPVLRKHGLDSVFLIAPTTPDARIAEVASHASGFLYYVSLKGVTGVRAVDADAVRERVASLRRHSRLPIAVGFGIRDAASARAIGALADAVVIGSALVTEVEALADRPPTQIAERLEGRVRELRTGLDAV